MGDYFDNIYSSYIDYSGLRFISSSSNSITTVNSDGTSIWYEDSYGNKYPISGYITTDGTDTYNTIYSSPFYDDKKETSKFEILTDITTWFEKNGFIIDRDLDSSRKDLSEFYEFKFNVDLSIISNSSCLRAMCSDLYEENEKLIIFKTNSEEFLEEFKLCISFSKDRGWINLYSDKNIKKEYIDIVMRDILKLTD